MHPHRMPAVQIILSSHHQLSSQLFGARKSPSERPFSDWLDNQSRRLELKGSPRSAFIGCISSNGRTKRSTTVR